MILKWIEFLANVEYHCLDPYIDINDTHAIYYINTSLCLRNVLDWNRCCDCKHYEDDYALMGEDMLVHGEWCHKTGEAVRFTSMNIIECEDYEKEDLDYATNYC